MSEHEFIVDNGDGDGGGTAWLTVHVNGTEVYDGAVSEGTGVAVESTPFEEYVEQERESDE